MGANTFETAARGQTAPAAFEAAREQAFSDHGHAGYTGTLAEKHDFTVIPVPEGQDPREFARSLIDADDVRVSDKWGPAGCIKLSPEDWLFFGWASS